MFTSGLSGVLHPHEAWEAWGRAAWGSLWRPWRLPSSGGGRYPWNILAEWAKHAELLLQTEVYYTKVSYWYALIRIALEYSSNHFLFQIWKTIIKIWWNLSVAMRWAYMNWWIAYLRQHYSAHFHFLFCRLMILQYSINRHEASFRSQYWS